MKIPTLVLLLIGLPGLALAGAEPTQPAGLLLTWQHDPTSTITIDWHTVPGDRADPVVQFRPAGAGEWRRAEAQAHPFPYSDRTVHRVELTGLEPASLYEFKVGEFTRIYSVRTMPRELRRPLRFAAGGDTSYGEVFQRMNRVAMRYDPDFIVWGGDLAYANGSPEGLPRWLSWFERIRDDLVTPDGRVVPIIAAIGNHEVRTRGHYPSGDTADFTAREAAIGESTREWREENAPYYYRLIAFPGHPGYGVLDFGDYLSLILLDSSHTNLIGGQQTRWLEETLRTRRYRSHLVPVYHKPAYPSHRVKPGGERTQIWTTQVLRHWVPLFERYGVRVALEHDDHTYKRTHPLRGDKIDPTGIVYLGDGSWGVKARTPRTPEDVWYLARSAGKNHAIIVTLQDSHQHFLVVDDQGGVIDEYPEAPKRPPE
jgi:hypothetical protein